MTVNCIPIKNTAYDCFYKVKTFIKDSQNRYLLQSIYYLAMNTLTFYARLINASSLAFFLPKTLTTVVSLLNIDTVVKELVHTCRNVKFAYQFSDRTTFLYTLLKVFAQGIDFLLLVTGATAAFIGMINPALALAIYFATTPLSMISIVWLIPITIIDHYKAKHIRKEFIREIGDSQEKINQLSKEILLQSHPSKLATKIRLHLDYYTVSKIETQYLKGTLLNNESKKTGDLAISAFNYISWYSLKLVPIYHVAHQAIFWFSSFLSVANNLRYVMQEAVNKKV